MNRNITIKNLIILVIGVVAICFTLSACGAEGLKINKENFPDESFKNCLLSLDEGEDKVLTDEEIAGITEIHLYNCNVRDLTGIEHFVNLKKLDCSSCQLTKLSLEHNTMLEELDCSLNDLSELDMSENVNLVCLHCSYNDITQLDLSNNPKLTTLYCERNDIKQLDLSNNTKLTEIFCDKNQITSLNIQNCSDLLYLSCAYNELTMLDVSNNAKLESLYCNGNKLQNLDISNNTALTSYRSDFGDNSQNNNSNNSTKKSNIEGDTWYTLKSNNIFYCQNAEVESAVSVSHGSGFWVTYYPVCKDCHICGAMRTAGVTTDTPVSETYYCQNCGTTTYARFKIEY